MITSSLSSTGKTETIKILLNHIAEIAAQDGKENNSCDIFDKVLSCNPLLGK